MNLKVSQQTSFLLDPYKDGTAPSALWKAISGTQAIVSNKYNFSGASSQFITIADLKFGRHLFYGCDFGLTGVQTPTNLNNDIEFGLKQITIGKKITFLLDKSADALVCQSGDGSATTTVAWQTAWNDAAAIFEIRWYDDRIVFLVNNVVVAEHKRTSSSTTDVPRVPMNHWISTTGTDTLKVALVHVDDADQSSIVIA